MKVESIAECFHWSILQYFWPALSDNWYWKPILVFFLSGRLKQVLLYHVFLINAIWFMKTSLVSEQNMACIDKVVQMFYVLWCLFVYKCRYVSRIAC